MPGQRRRVVRLTEHECAVITGSLQQMLSWIQLTVATGARPTDEGRRVLARRVKAAKRILARRAFRDVDLEGV